MSVLVDFPDSVLMVFHHFLLLRLPSESSFFSFVSSLGFLFYMIVILSSFCKLDLIFLCVVILELLEKAALLGSCPFTVVIKPYLITCLL